MYWAKQLIQSQHMPSLKAASLAFLDVCVCVLACSLLADTCQVEGMWAGRHIILFVLSFLSMILVVSTGKVFKLKFKLILLLDFS